MKPYILIFLFPFLAPSAFSQAKNDVGDALKAALASPAMAEAFQQEWGELRPLYLRQNEPSVSDDQTEEAFSWLSTNDFGGLEWEVIPATNAEITQLPLEKQQFAILDAGISFRGPRAVVSLFVNLPQHPRSYLSGSFLLEKEGEQWTLIQESVEIRK